LSQLTLDLVPLDEKEEYKPYRWITLDEQKRFNEFLKYLGINYDKLDWCGSEWEKYHCLINHSHQSKTRYLPCGLRGICPRCSMSYASKRAEIQYQYFKRNIADRVKFHVKINQIVLTLPESLHDMDKKLFVRMVKEFMNLYGIKNFGYCVQDRHSKDPLAGSYLHCHVLTLNIKEVDGMILRNDYYFDLDLMRMRWKEIIEKRTDVKIEGSVNLHSEYADVIQDKNKVVHMLSYLYRYPVEDLFNVQIRKQSINYVQSLQFEKSETDTPIHTLQIKDMQKKVMDLFDSDKPRIVWCGLLASAKRNHLQELISKWVEEGSFIWFRLPDIIRMIESRSKECRDCGSPYEKEPYDRGKYQFR